MKEISKLTLFILPFLLMGCLGPIGSLLADQNAPIPTAIAVATVPATPTDIPPEPTAIATEIPPEPTIQPTAVPTEAPTEVVMVEPTPEPTSTPQPVPTAIPLPGTELFTFVRGEPGWFIVDDSVMGGVSKSTVAAAEPNQLYFSGTMSLDNNGGFSSVRSDWSQLDLTGNDGILLRVKGDGKIYRLRIRTESAGRNISYNALFETTADEWTLAYIPFEAMVPTLRGFVMDVGPLDPATVGSFGFMLSDKQEGEFELYVDWMRAVSEDELRAIGQSSG